MSRRYISRAIARVVPPTQNKVVNRLVGSVDIDGAGTEHSLTDAEVDPFILLDQAYLPKDGKPPFGSHPHRGHSVVTVLMQGKMESWDSFGRTKHVLTGPASYWVDAGSGVFHDETTVIEDEDDREQHISLAQLWVGVREADRLKPTRVQMQESLPVEDIRDDESGDVVGTSTWFVGGNDNTIETPHPIRVSMVHQDAGTTYRLPVPASFGGFIVNLSGNDKMSATKRSSEDHPATFGDVKPQKTLDVMVLANNSDKGDDGNNCDALDHVVTVVTSQDAPADYLVCIGERNGPDEPSYKKLVANGAVIAKTPEEARAIAKQVETMAAAGHEEGGSFAPFGA